MKEKKEEKKEEIFITYANTSLKENPEVLYGIFEKFKNLVRVSLPEEERLKKIIGYFVRTVKCKDIKKAEKEKTDFEKELVKKRWEKWKIRKEMWLYDIAFGGIFGYRDGYCNNCFWGFGRSIFLGEEVFSGPKRIKCYECSQLELRMYLEGIVAGKEYSEIGPQRDLKSFLGYSKSWVHESIEVKNTTSESLFKEELTKATIFTLNQLLFHYGHGNQHCIQGIFHQTIMGTCLAEFLLLEDRRKLKRCLKCKKFFVSEKVDERIKHCPTCSQKSGMTKEQRNEYQRNYNAKKKKERDDQKNEARIKNLMKNLTITREEAMEIIKADSKV